MIISGKALRRSLKKGRVVAEKLVGNAPLARCEFDSKTSLGGRGSEAMSFSYNGSVTVMRKGLIVAGILVGVATVGCIICAKMRCKCKDKSAACCEVME